MSKLLFAYGTLKSDQRGGGFMEGQKLLGEAITEPKYQLYNCGSYPCLVEDDENGVAVVGELWEINEDLIPGLDAYEGAPFLFRQGTVKLSSHPNEDVMVYFFNQPTARLRVCGSIWPIKKA